MPQIRPAMPQLYSSYVAATPSRRPAMPQVNPAMPQLCSSYVPLKYVSYAPDTPSHASVILKLRPSYAQHTSNYAPGKPSYAPAMLQLCSSYVPATPSYAPGTPSYAPVMFQLHGSNSLNFQMFGNSGN